MLVVVVLPCAPATAIVRFSALNSRSSSARGTTVRPRSAAASSSGLSAPIAVERTTSVSGAAGRLDASCPARASMPAPRSRSSAGESARSEPLTAAPSCAATVAYPLMPAPPIPTR